jgi:translocation and assembly module TamA
MPLFVALFLTFRPSPRLSLLCLLLGLLQTTSAWALDYKLTGIESSTLKDNIKLHLQNVHLNDHGLLDNSTSQTIEDAVNTALQPYGYYNAEISISQPSLQENASQSDTPVNIQVILGSPLLVANVNREIIGDARTDKDFKARYDNFPMAIGEVLNQPKYAAFKSSMFNYALAHGYFNFYWQATRLDIVREENEANILLIAQSGPQYKFGELKISGDKRAEAIINRLKPFTVGEKYTSAKLTEFNRVLNQTGYFERIIARPLVSEADEQHQVPIEVTLGHLPRDIFNLGGGADTDTKGRVRARWERPWVNSRGHSLAAEVYLSNPEQSVGIDYKIPMKDVNNDYASFKTSYQFDDSTSSDSESETLSVSAHRFWRDDASNWQKSISLTFERETFTQGASDEQTTSLLMPGYSLSYLKADDNININNGQYYLMSVQAGHDSLISDISIVIATAKAKYITTLNDSHRIMLRASTGIIETDDFDRVPSSLRFFAGGDQSIRGFSYESISPIEIDDDGDEELTGGRYLATASIEYAYPVSTNWRAAVFADIGTATVDFSEDPATGIGIGAHWLTMIGPVRFYIARGHSDYESTWRFHFTLGPEL